ncbi:MAG TPA: PstS family phosphate ABC transporter substrate-binding protein [Prolixibacteraceae bacterium]|nr:PstS family phosphate ABC transporter substrate-binding protein [Prolixibacteraceae bacterium]
MKLNIITFMLLSVLLLSSCSSQKKRDNTITISGAFALYPLVVTWAENYKKENPEIRINISGGGAGKGMADALSGAVDLGMFSRKIEQVEIEQGVWWTGTTIDAVLPTISAKNPLLEKIKTRGITRDELKSIYIDETITNWNQLFENTPSNPIKLYSRSDACGAAGTWALYLDGTQEDLNGVGVFGDPGLAEAVSIDPSGIGFNNTIFIYDIKTGRKRVGMEVCPIDLNNNGTIDPEEYFYDSFKEILAAIANGNYPSPPARELFLVAKGKPQKQSVVDFLKWILTTGQQYVEEVGYVPLSDATIANYLIKLEE